MEIPVIGIDFGTSYSIMGYFDINVNNIVLIPDEFNQLSMPSIISFDENEKNEIVGRNEKEKLNKLLNNNFIRNVKIFLGLSKKELLLIKNYKLDFSCDFIEEDFNNKIKIPLIINNENDLNEKNNKKKYFYFEQLCAMILKKLKKNVEKYLKIENIFNVVISIPTYFKTSQIEALKHAAFLANLNVIEFIDELSACFLIESKNFEDKKNILVFKLGGGIFELNLINLFKEENQQKLNILASNKIDINFSGVEFDKKITFEILNKINSNLHSNIEKFIYFLSFYSKEEFSKKNEIFLNDLNIKINKKDFDKICDDFNLKLKENIENILKNAKINKNEIDDVLLIGGIAKIPKIQEMIKNYFNLENLNILDQFSITKGIALKSFLLNRNISKNIKTDNFLNQIHFNLGLNLNDDEIDVFIKKNDFIPIKKSKIYTIENNEKIFNKFIYEGKNKLIKNSNCLGSISLNISNKIKRKNKIKVSFEINENLILIITIEDENDLNNKSIINFQNERLFSIINYEKEENNYSTNDEIFEDEYFINYKKEILNNLEIINDETKIYKEKFDEFKNLLLNIECFIKTFELHNINNNILLLEKYIFYLKILFKKYSEFFLIFNNLINNKIIDEIKIKIKNNLEILIENKNINFYEIINDLKIFPIIYKFCLIFIIKSKVINANYLINNNEKNKAIKLIKEILDEIKYFEIKNDIKEYDNKYSENNINNIKELKLYLKNVEHKK